MDGAAGAPIHAVAAGFNPAGRLNMNSVNPVERTMAITIRFLPPRHELITDTDASKEAMFDESGNVLVVLDDHGYKQVQAFALPADPEIERFLERLLPRLIENARLDAFEAVRDVLVRRGIPELTADAVIETAGVAARQPKIPEGWTAWGAIPRGSLSSSGEGRWIIVWPEADERGRDMAYFAAGADIPTDSPNAVLTPELTYNPVRQGAPFVKLHRAGLTAEQIDAFLRHTVDPAETPADAMARLFPTAEAA